jgi:hypothetical protein
MTDELWVEQLEGALAALGEILAAEGNRLAIVVVGGATMNLLGIIRRSTSDIDVIARAHRDETGALRIVPPEPFPPELRQAIRTVARDLGLADEWMNAVVGAQWALGLPPDITEDITWRNYGGGLDVGLVGRRTLIALKLFAAADGAPGSVHVQDLVALQPTPAELASAVEWVRTQDEAPEWTSLVEEVCRHVERSCS